MVDGLKFRPDDPHYNKSAILFKTKSLLSTLQTFGNSLRGSSTDIFICKVLAVHHKNTVTCFRTRPPANLRHKSFNFYTCRRAKGEPKFRQASPFDNVINVEQGGGEDYDESNEEGYLGEGSFFGQGHNLSRVAVSPCQDLRPIIVIVSEKVNFFQYLTLFGVHDNLQSGFYKKM